ncbi:helix-turn-helix domain-containing protein [Brucella sp. BO2]|uniref:helix-turn-helix domain-containing protein n=1 Tax=Brucella sp. BO2 TaxID=693750 RepID=UPI00046CF93A|nr:helix-turn-helix domain-containing protein [Brucella sp. BO2]
MAGITLTPGSRRKLLRHIDEGLYIGDLARKMDISLVAIRKIILADEELKEVCHQNGILSPEGVFALGKPIDIQAPSGMNPSFVRKVWAKRRREAEVRAIEEQESKAEEVIPKYRAQTIRQCGRKATSTMGETIILDSKQSIRQIIDRVIAGTDVTYEDIIGKRRCYKVVQLRHQAMADAVAIRPDLSLPTIGRLFGGRDHTTVLHAAKKMGITGRKARKGKEVQAVSEKVGVSVYPVLKIEPQNQTRAA